MEARKISFFDFTNKVMSNVYNLIFNKELPRVSEDMKSKLQLSLEPTRDWILFKAHTIIRVYGFSEARYVLPTFLTSYIFSLEFMRQRLHFETDHFLNFKKDCNIKFHYNIGPFVIKSRSFVPIIEELLKAMVFQVADKIRYDPKYVISQRRQKNKNTPYDHLEVEGLKAIASLENAEEAQQMIDISDEVENSQDGTMHINPITLVIQTLAKNDNVNKRPSLEVVDMDVDEQSSSKRTKTTTNYKVIVDLEEEESTNQGGNVVIVQEEGQDQSVTNT